MQARVGSPDRPRLTAVLPTILSLVAHNLKRADSPRVLRELDERRRRSASIILHVSYYTAVTGDHLRGAPVGPAKSARSVHRSNGSRTVEFGPVFGRGMQTARLGSGASNKILRARRIARFPRVYCLPAPSVRRQVAPSAATNVRDRGCRQRCALSRGTPTIPGAHDNVVCGGTVGSRRLPSSWGEFLARPGASALQPGRVVGASVAVYNPVGKSCARRRAVRTVQADDKRHRWTRDVSGRRYIT